MSSKLGFWDPSVHFHRVSWHVCFVLVWLFVKYHMVDMSNVTF